MQPNVTVIVDEPPAKARFTLFPSAFYACTQKLKSKGKATSGSTVGTHRPASKQVLLYVRRCWHVLASFQEATPSVLQPDVVLLPPQAKTVKPKGKAKGKAKNAIVVEVPFAASWSTASTTLIVHRIMTTAISRWVRCSRNGVRRPPSKPR